MSSWPVTKRGRKIFSGAILAALSMGSGFSLKGRETFYVPESPPYRQMGDLQAPIILVEFSDFQCPGCATAEEPLSKILNLYGSKIRFIYKHFPLEFHSWARMAAIASECAGLQGKFWPYHHKLYASQKEWSAMKNPPEAFKKFAREIGLHTKEFEACLQSPPAQVVEKDILDGKNRWVRSTPTFFINSRRAIGANQLRTKGLKRIEEILGKR